jgi:elongation factor G
MKRYDVPRIIFVNKLDRMGADPWEAIEGARARLGLNCAAVQVNIGVENGLEGVVDLVNWKAYYFDGPSGEHVREEEIPAALLEQATDKKLELLSCLAECGEEQMEEYFLEENIDIPAEELKQCIRKNTIGLKFCPVFMGSAYKNKGVQAMMDGILDYLPKPTEVVNHAYDHDKDGEKTLMVIDNKKPFVGLAFKLEETKFGQVTYVRVYQGKIKKGQLILNANTKKKVKVSRMVRMHSADMEDIEEAGAGDIFALFGVDCASGETFCDPNANVQLTEMHVPDPVMSLTVKNKNVEDLDDFLKALNRFQREDPTFTVQHNQESEEIIISGMGELHLFVYCERIKREYGVDIVIGTPTVNYREAIGSKAQFSYLHKKQSGGAGQYAKVIGYVEPINSDITAADAELGNVFKNETEGQNVPNEYIPAIEKAFHEFCKRGPKTGYPVVGMRYALTDG